MKLISFIQTHGHSNWRSLPKLAGLARCGKSCRLRWVNYLSPDIKRGNFTVEEEDAIIKLHETLGNRWSKIASHFPGRTDNEIKNVWNTHLKKRIKTKESSATISSQEPLDEVLINGNNNNIIINECKQKILMHQTISSRDMTPNEQQLQLQQLNSPSTSCCSQASFSGLQVNDFNPTKGFVTKDVPDICDMDEIGINVNEMETDLVDELLNTPFEPNFEWCDLLDGDYNSATQSQVKLNEYDALNNNLISSNEKNNNSEESDGSWWWLVYLENELGLLSQS